jgi:hypothetical protein
MKQQNQYISLTILINFIKLMLVIEKHNHLICHLTQNPLPTGRTCSASPKAHRSLSSAFASRRRESELALLSLEDQVFVTAFLRSHGTIKEMEQTFGVSYPTIKARLTRIAGQLEFVDTNPTPSRSEVLARLKNGEISAAEAIRELEELK